MRFTNRTKRSRKSSMFANKALRPSIIGLRREEEKQRLANAENSPVVAVKMVDKQNETILPSETKTNIPQISTGDQLSKIEIKNKDSEDNESEPEVESCGMTTPPKGPVQISTQIDMDKDEWTLGELLDLNVTEVPFLVNRLIPLHTLNVLAGQSERGKSTLYTQLSLAIIRGDDEFLGSKLNTTHKRVLVISTEDGPIALSFRANKQISQVDSTVEFRERLTFITNQDNLEDRIEKYLEKTRVDLIVMDAFGDVFTGGDINASNSVRRYLDNYMKFIRRYGCTVLFVHHVGKGRQGNKPEKDQLLGSTGIEGKMRNVLMLSIVNDQHQLSIAKSNYVNREDKKIPLYLNFNNETLTFSKADGPAKPQESDESGVASNGESNIKRKPGIQIDMKLYNQAIQLYKEGKSQVEIAKIVNKDKSTICKWIKKSKSE
jgi:RecA-family ATPase